MKLYYFIHNNLSIAELFNGGQTERPFGVQNIIIYLKLGEGRQVISVIVHCTMSSYLVSYFNISS